MMPGGWESPRLGHPPGVTSPKAETIFCEKGSEEREGERDRDRDRRTEGERERGR